LKVKHRMPSPSEMLHLQPRAAEVTRVHRDGDIGAGIGLGAQGRSTEPPS
jgi:hypothetical protein